MLIEEDFVCGKGTFIKEEPPLSSVTSKIIRQPLYQTLKIICIISRPRQQNLYTNMRVSYSTATMGPGIRV